MKKKTKNKKTNKKTKNNNTIIDNGNNNNNKDNENNKNNKSNEENKGNKSNNDNNNKEFKLLDPKNDIVFQMLFFNDNLAKWLLSNVVSMDVNSLSVNVNKQLLGDSPEDKLGIVDLRVIINGKIECEVEMQMYYFKNFIPRFLHYWARIYSSQLKKGNNYDLLHKVVSIALVNENIPYLKGLPAHTMWNIREASYHDKILTNNLELHIIELQKVKEEYENNKDDKLLQWIMFLLDPESEEVDNIMVKNKEIREAKKELISLSQDEENQRLAYFREREIMDKRDMYETGMDEGEAKGIEKGLAEGRADRTREVIINLLKMKMPIDKIIEATDATKEEIEKIKESENL